MYCFFFFKQKTAYEMRISDWSSDVCSSDLEVAIGERVERECRGERAHRRRHLLGRHPALGGAGLVILAHRRCAAIERLLLHLDDRHRDSRRQEVHRNAAAQDRKSVVSGKSVSVRVDLGGRSTIQKTNNTQTKYT